MTAGKRRTISRLRALAASTTFPEEAASARAKADKLEAEIEPEAAPSPSFRASLDLNLDFSILRRNSRPFSPDMQSAYDMLIAEVERQMRRRGG